MTSIFVGNLPYNMDESELRRLFERFGFVSSARIVSDRSTSRPRGFAFVSMPSLDDADEAINRLSGTVHGGRALNVHASHERRGESGRDEDGERIAVNTDRTRALAMFDALNGP